MFESRKLSVVLLSVAAWFPAIVSAAALEAPKLRVEMAVQASPTTSPAYYPLLAGLVEVGLPPIKRCFGSALARNVETQGAVRLRIKFDDLGRSTVTMIHATVDQDLQRCVMQAVASADLKTPPTKSAGFLSVDFVNSVGRPARGVKVVKGEVKSTAPGMTLGAIAPLPDAAHLPDRFDSEPSAGET